MSDYHAFCERHAARCAAERAEEEHFQRVMDASSTQRQRSGAADLIYKTHHNDTPPSRERVMFNAIAEALALLRMDMREHVKKELSGLREEVAALRADLTITRSIIASRNVLPINRDDGVVREDAEARSFDVA
jgi:hypothetical protein